MKKEIGGYLELDTYSLPMLHENALALNSGRGCLEYLITQKHIRRIALPHFVCDAVTDTCRKMGVALSFYHIGRDFLPIDPDVDNDAYMYLVNFYGQLDENRLLAFREKYPRLIVDNAQAYFSPAMDGVDTLYTCRKFFGVADGGFLYTDAPGKALFRDESHERMGFVLGRYERPAGEFYAESSKNNDLFSTLPVMAMSGLTMNLLHAIDYEQVKKARTENFALLHRELGNLNGLDVRLTEGAYAYPLLLDNGGELRKILAEKKIFVPTLWPNVLRETGAESLEYNFAKNILPLPCDQRYGEEEMLYISEVIKSCIC